MYRSGDLVVYGSMGVCRIEGISRPDNNGKEFYVLAPLCQSGTVYTPVDSGKIPLRAVMTKDEALALLDRIPSIQAEGFRERTIQQLTHRYQSILQSGSATELLTLILSVHRKRQEAQAQNRRLGMVDDRFGRQAERLLFGELAAALDMDIAEVSDIIFGSFSAAK